MSIFATAIARLTFDDLQELLTERAVETVRLEFKREVPNKGETLKKLSSFANTLGGYMVVGAEAGNDGRITALTGVSPQASYKQTIIQWCFDGVSPPLDLEVSDPIPVPSVTDRVVYVVAVRESEIAPHFLNGRKGVYVRTDEFSSRVKSELATDAELQLLFRRRAAVIERRRALVARSRERFATFAAQKYKELGEQKSTGIGARFELSVGPTFPMNPLCGEAKLMQTIVSERLSWRGTGFPRTSEGIISQCDSVIVLRPGSSFSILDANLWGLLYYATEIEMNDPARCEGIHTYHFVGQLEIFLRHAAHTLKSLGYSGSLRIEIVLRGLRGVPWLYLQFNSLEVAAASVLDDDASTSLDSSTLEITNTPDRVMLNLLRFVFFAVGWHELATDDTQLKEMVKWGYQYNYSQRPASLRV